MMNHVAFLSPRLLRGALFAAPLALALLAACDRSAKGATGGGAESARPVSALEREQAQQRVLDLRGVGYDVGDPNAPITVVEFSDFGCRFCRQFATETYPVLYREFVMSGKVRWKYVPYVLGIFPNGELAARAGECAAEQGDRTFWAMHDLLFEHQREWQKGEARATFTQLAKEAGLDTQRFQGCYDKDLRGERVRANNTLGRSLGVRGTPAFFINGSRVEGAIPLEAFRMGLNQMLAEMEAGR